MSDLDLSTIASERLAIVRAVMTNERHDVWSGDEFDAWIASIAAQVREQIAQEIDGMVQVMEDLVGMSPTVTTRAIREVKAEALQYAAENVRGAR